MRKFTVDAGTEELVIKTCSVCGIIFAVPDWFEENAEREGPRGLGWHCPLGHSRVYTQGQKEKDEIARLKEQVAVERDNAGFWREQERVAKRQATAQKAAKTRLKNRIANGVCPVCKRHFVNVERHMKGQHPKFTDHED